MSAHDASSRPPIETGLHHMLQAEVAIWPADWERFAAATAAARECGVPRAQFEEMLLQATLFYGFPRLVTAFEHLLRIWPAAAAPAGGGLPAATQREAGAALFAAIYGRNEAAVRDLLRTCHGEFHDFVLEAAYGRILTRPGLPPRERELLAVAALAAMAQPRQLLAHARGALRFGAGRDQVLAACRCGDGTAAGELALRL